LPFRVIEAKEEHEEITRKLHNRFLESEVHRREYFIDVGAWKREASIAHRLGDARDFNDLGVRSAEIAALF
jgi:hypothetical protein